MAKSSSPAFASLGLEVAPPRIIATHRRKSSDFKLDTILEDNALLTFSPQSESPSCAYIEESAALTRLAKFATPDPEK